MAATAGGWNEDGDGVWGAEGMAEPGAERAWDDEPLNDRPLYDGRPVRDLSAIRDATRGSEVSLLRQGREMSGRVR